MAMTLDMMLHVSGGTVGLIAGAAALMIKKGSFAHRQAGKLFVLSMFVMAITGVSLAYAKSSYISMLAGTLSLYLVLSGWIAANKRPASSSYKTGILALGLLVLLLGLYLSWKGYNGVTDKLPGFTVPAQVYYTFTIFALLGVVGDIIVVSKNRVSNSYRIARHIWRMCVPLYIGASSFFRGQQDVLPEAIRGTFFLEVPQYLVLLTMLYWLGSTFLTSKYGLVLKNILIGEIYAKVKS